jgi:hypothetical protein
MQFSRLLVLLAALVPLSAISQQSCSKPVLQSAAQQVRAAQIQLLAYKIEDGDERVPADLQAEIRAMKDALAAGVDAVMQCAHLDATSTSLENSLTDFLIEAKPPRRTVPPGAKDFVYGKELRLKVVMPEQAKNLTLVELHFDIVCGFDSMLLGYEKQDGAWKRTLRWESPAYDTVGKAFGDMFKYEVLPQVSSHDWLIAVAHGSPWCTSNFAFFDVDLLEPVSGHSGLRVLDHKKLFYWRDEDTAMKLTSGGFQLHATGLSIDTDVVRRPVIYRFQVANEKLVRVQPVANNGRDFVDEWLQSPWNDAARWSTAQSLADLQQIHEKLSKLHSGEDSPLSNYGAVRSCADSKAHYQVELDENWIDAKGKSSPGPTTYFQIEVDKNSATMLSASATKDPRCTGADIMPKQ